MNDKIRGVTNIETYLPTYLLNDPFLIDGDFAKGDNYVALATLERPLIPSINRGRKVINLSGGAKVKILKDEMTRAPLLSSRNIESLDLFIQNNYRLLEEVANSTTHHGKLTSLESKLYNQDIYLRLGMFCGDSAGHNMTEKAADAVCKYLKIRFPNLKYYLSSNYCTDKKPAQINIENGRGKTIEAKVILPESIIHNYLKTTGKKLAKLNEKKNIFGSRLAGSLGKNAHHANIIAAIYAATGQDLGNVVEGSLGRTQVDCSNDETLFSVYLPSIIVGTVGGGTSFAKEKLELMGCYGSGDPVGINAKKLAEITAVTVLAGELSLMASLTNEDELLNTHLCYERK